MSDLTGGGAAIHEAVSVGQVWEWLGQQQPRDRYRVEFVGVDTAALALIRRPPDSRPQEVARVTFARLAAEYRLADEIDPREVTDHG